MTTLTLLDVGLAVTVGLALAGVSLIAGEAWWHAVVVPRMRRRALEEKVLSQVEQLRELEAKETAQLRDDPEDNPQ